MCLDPDFAQPIMLPIAVASHSHFTGKRGDLNDEGARDALMVLHPLVNYPRVGHLITLIIFIICNRSVVL